MRRNDQKGIVKPGYNGVLVPGNVPHLVAIETKWKAYTMLNNNARRNSGFIYYLCLLCLRVWLCLCACHVEIKFLLKRNVLDTTSLPFSFEKELI